MRKLLIIIIVIIVVFFIWQILSREEGVVEVSPPPSPEATEGTASPSPSPILTPPTPASTPTVLPSRTHDINITDTGFSPSLLTIKVGDTVRFVNAGNNPHWPASGIHPTHQICQGLNSLKGLKKGESYSFTFTEVKDCPIHDHLNPSIKGNIRIGEIIIN